MPQAYVYITLPGATQAVTAGRFEHEVDRNGVAVGRFVYGRRYRKRPDAVEIDPFELRLGRAQFETVRLNGVFGALRDSSPDYWGRRVIEKHAGVDALGELDYLLHSPNDRAGALGFGLGVEPLAPIREFNKTWDLEKLQALADTLIADQAPKDAAAVEELLLLGTSMGGARPKVVVEHDGALWLAKFNRADDRWNMARMEHATLLLARRCGLQAPDSQVVTVGGRDVLLVRRFDRERAKDGYARARMVSALTLLETDETPDGRARWSYVILAETLRRISERPREGRARTVPPHGLQRPDLEHRRPPAQPCRHRARPGLAPVAGLRPLSDTVSQRGPPRPGHGLRRPGALRQRREPAQQKRAVPAASCPSRRRGGRSGAGGDERMVCDRARGRGQRG